MKELDEERSQAARALSTALARPNWGSKRFQSGKMTRDTLNAFAPYEQIPEVKQLTDAIHRKEPVEGLLLHYLKRRYPEQEAINSPDDLNVWFEQVLQDRNAKLMKPRSPDSRYLVYSEKYRLLAVIDRNGQRVSVHKHDGFDVEDVWLTLAELIR
jgi:hypothetical protein